MLSSPSYASTTTMFSKTSVKNTAKLWTTSTPQNSTNISKTPGNCVNIGLIKEIYYFPMKMRIRQIIRYLRVVWVNLPMLCLVVRIMGSRPRMLWSSSCPVCLVWGLGLVIWHRRSTDRLIFMILAKGWLYLRRIKIRRRAKATCLKIYKCSKKIR